MARVKTGVVRRKKHKKVLKEAKGFQASSGTVIKQAKQATMRAAAYSTRDRMQRKRKMRELWIIRINAAARLFDLSYSKFMNGLKKAGIELDRKVLAEMAYTNTEEFGKLVAVAKENL
ncbi:MAG: 50S ribosomal protein L20 [Fusobacteria bacterium]|jgi:large subunit ribosomal protein L20|nr:50S ribosomal protein L20 [Fusobacteriota bacterium]